MTSCGQDYISALERSSSVEDTIDLVEKSIQEPSIYFYGAILHSPTWQRVPADAPSPRSSMLHRMRSLLSYSVITDAVKSPEANKLLSSDLRTKPQLSLLSFGCEEATGRSEISLQTSVVPSTTEEQVVVDAVSNNLLHARLNPMKRTMRVLKVMQGRDGPLGKLVSLKEKLKRWDAVCEAQLQSLEYSLRMCEEEEEALNAKLHQ